jgi:uncharacterized protein
MTTGLLLSHPFFQAFIGGLLIGFASWLLLSSLGKVAGISGIAAGLLGTTRLVNGGTKDDDKTRENDKTWRWAFLFGLIVIGSVTGTLLPAPVMPLRSLWLLATAGLLVGFGTVLGSGCTSGHGVCGLGRRSVRSLAATLTFMGAGVVTVYLRALFSMAAGV